MNAERRPTKLPLREPLPQYRGDVDRNSFVAFEIEIAKDVIEMLRHKRRRYLAVMSL